MTRLLALAMCAGWLAGCTGGNTSEQSPVAAPTEEATAPSYIHQTSAKGLRLFMHEYSPTGGGARKPTVAIVADAGTQTQAGLWSIENAHFTFYRGEEEHLTLQSGHAEIDETNERAQLSQGVQAQAGDMALELEGIRWDNEAGLAESDGAVTLVRGDTRLDADSVVIDPKASLLTCRNARGRFSLSETPS